MNSTNSNSTVEISMISIDTEDTTIVSASYFLESSNDFHCFVYRTSGECWGIQGSSQGIDSVCARDDFSSDDIFGMDDRTCLA